MKYSWYICSSCLFIDLLAYWVLHLTTRRKTENSKCLSCRITSATYCKIAPSSSVELQLSRVRNLRSGSFQFRASELEPLRITPKCIAMFLMAVPHWDSFGRLYMLSALLLRSHLKEGMRWDRRDEIWKDSVAHFYSSSMLMMPVLEAAPTLSEQFLKPTGMWLNIGQFCHKTESNKKQAKLQLNSLERTVKKDSGSKK